MKRAYYTAVFAGLYGTAGLVLAASALLSGCGSGPRLGGSSAGTRAPALVRPIPPLPPAVTYAPPENVLSQAPTEIPPVFIPAPGPGPVAVIQPVGPPVALGR